MLLCCAQGLLESVQARNGGILKRHLHSAGLVNLVEALVEPIVVGTELLTQLLLKLPQLILLHSIRFTLLPLLFNDSSHGAAAQRAYLGQRPPRQMGQRVLMAGRGGAPHPPWS